MASTEAFLPVATDERADLEVPMYSPEVPPSDFTMASASAQVNVAPVTGQQHLYFKYCCDTRRAVLFVNIVTIVLDLIALLVNNVEFNFILHHEDEVEQNMSDAQKANLEHALYSHFLKMDAFLVVLIVMHGCGIYGALKFKKWAVVTAGFAYTITFVLHLLDINIPAVIIAVALGYPHYFFIKEINEGLMSDYNYHNVAHCCGGK